MRCAVWESSSSSPEELLIPSPTRVAAALSAWLASCSWTLAGAHASMRASIHPSTSSQLGSTDAIRLVVTQRRHHTSPAHCEKVRSATDEPTCQTPNLTWPPLLAGRLGCLRSIRTGGAVPPKIAGQPREVEASFPSSGAARSSGKEAKRAKARACRRVRGDCHRRHQAAANPAALALPTTHAGAQLTHGATPSLARSRSLCRITFPPLAKACEADVEPSRRDKLQLVDRPRLGRHRQSSRHHDFLSPLCTY